jgi:uncharacterized membrane protein YfcA
MLTATILGLLVGIVLGLTGAGGGILAIPALTMGLGWSMAQAVPVALVAVGTAAAAGAIGAWRQGLVRYRAALLMAALGAVVSPLGLRLAARLPESLLAALLGALLLFIAVRTLLGTRRGAEEKRLGAHANCLLDPCTGRLCWNLKCSATLAAVGSLSGLLSGLLGVGGGFLLVPALQQFTNVRLNGVIATSLMAMALVSGSTAVSAIYAGASVDILGMGFVATSVVGMLTGRRLFSGLPSRYIQLGFASLCVTAAAYLLFRP